MNITLLIEKITHDLSLHACKEQQNLKFSLQRMLDLDMFAKLRKWELLDLNSPQNFG